MIADTIPQLNELNLDQKLLLVTELWESVTASRVDIPVSKALFEELDRRHKEYLADPSQVTFWKEARERIRASCS